MAQECTHLTLGEAQPRAVLGIRLGEVGFMCQADWSRFLCWCWLSRVGCHRYMTKWQCIRKIRLSTAACKAPVLGPSSCQNPLTFIMLGWPPCQRWVLGQCLQRAGSFTFGSSAISGRESQANAMVVGDPRRHQSLKRAGSPAVNDAFSRRRVASQVADGLQVGVASGWNATVTRCRR
jgi:hypothetical protein